MRVARWICVGILAFVFLAAATFKSVEFVGFVTHLQTGRVLQHLNVVGVGVLAGMAIGLEYFVAVTLFISKMQRISAYFALGLLSLYTAVALVEFKDVHQECRCMWKFAVLTVDSQAGLLIRNLLLCGVTVMLLVLPVAGRRTRAITA